MNNDFQHNSQRRNSQENTEPKKASSFLDNKEIIQLFIQGDSNFTYNQELQIESQMNLSMLKTHQGELIGLIKGGKENKTIEIKKSNFLKIIDEILVENNCAYLGDSLSRKNFVEYKKYELPSGYKLNYTEAKVLWKIWWPTQNFKNPNQLKLNLLVKFKDQWYPIKDIYVEEGKIYIITLRGEISLFINDKIFWLDKLEKLEKTTTIEEQPRPRMKQQRATVAQRYSLIQNLIDEEQGTTDVISENQVENDLSIERNELLKQIGAIGNSMRQMNITHQKQIVALQRQQAEDFNKLWRQLLSLNKKVQQLGMTNQGQKPSIPEPVSDEDTQSFAQSANENDLLDVEIASSSENNGLIQDLVKNLS